MWACFYHMHHGHCLKAYRGFDPLSRNQDETHGPREHPHRRGAAVVGVAWNPCPFISPYRHMHAHVHTCERRHTHTHARMVPNWSIAEWTTCRGKSFFVPFPDVYTIRLTSPLNTWVYSGIASLGVSANTAEEMVMVRFSRCPPEALLSARCHIMARRDGPVAMTQS